MGVFVETEIPRTEAREHGEALLDRLNDPATARAVGDLLDQISTLSGMLAAVGSFMGRGEEIMDNVAETYQEFSHLATGNPALANGVRTALKLASQGAPVMARVAETDLLDKVAGSALLDPELFDILEMVAGGVIRAHDGVAGHPGVRQPSLLQMGRTMNDPDVRRGVRFLLEMAKQLGRALGETAPPSTAKPSTATPSTAPPSTATPPSPQTETRE